MLGAVLAGLLAAYVAFAQRNVGASDWYGYYQQSLLLRQGRVALPAELPPAEFPSQAPMGYNLLGERFVPYYSPGYPLLMAVGGLAGLEFYVTPLAGLVGCLLMFRELSPRAGRWPALLLTVLWGASPIVFFGATAVLSDLVAAVFALGAYQAARRRRGTLAGVLLVFGTAVRPTNLLMAPALLPALTEHRQWRKFLAGAAIPALAYAAYNLSTYGAPWRTGYADIRGDLVPALFTQHVRFYAGQLAAQLGLPLLLLAAAGLLRAGREALALIGWFAAFALFYGFWRHPEGDDTWWWLRFLLPGLPPLFILAAEGWAGGARSLGARLPPAMAKAAAALVACALLVAPLRAVPFLRSQGQLKSTKAVEFRDIAQGTEAIVPPGSWVGSVEFAGAMRIYTSLGSFFSKHDNAEALILELQRRGHAVYILAEPWELRGADDTLSRRLRHFGAREVHAFPAWGDHVRLYALQAPR